ncbi:hypothetical protein D8S78_21780 [Natrialba swarupiae]|nr:hypothetical protein [Natrialba swarupiae]
MASAHVTTSDGSGSAWTNATGYYNLHLQPGTYTLEVTTESRATVRDGRRRRSGRRGTTTADIVVSRDHSSRRRRTYPSRFNRQRVRPAPPRVRT